jgi:archaetidylinositol phosphate synthase
VSRIQSNIIARRERAFLNWVCPRIPAWVMSDHLTALGVAGAVLVLVSQAASRSGRWFFWLASFGLVVHWFGDSLDGSIARFRGVERPIYGYFLDHTVDALCNLVIMVGFGLTLYIRMDVSLFALVGYFLLCMYVFINNHLSGVFRLSFVGMGPTEIRLCLIAVNTWMFFGGPLGFKIAGQAFSYYDAFLFFGASVMVFIFVFRVLIGIRDLRDPARSGTSPPKVATGRAAMLPPSNLK